MEETKKWDIVDESASKYSTTKKSIMTRLINHELRLVGRELRKKLHNDYLIKDILDRVRMGLQKDVGQICYVCGSADIFVDSPVFPALCEHCWMEMVKTRAGDHVYVD